MHFPETNNVNDLILQMKKAPAALKLLKILVMLLPGPQFVKYFLCFCYSLLTSLALSSKNLSTNLT